ncbi:MAG: hypothetical protein EON59_07290 [Alphaproteobacteria bacterium]|nr:MAG: hypothetical protein EON59_07290 [Alphaproteobacteria bacterium]
MHFWRPPYRGLGLGWHPLTGSEPAGVEACLADALEPTELTSATRWCNSLTFNAIAYADMLGRLLEVVEGFTIL